MVGLYMLDQVKQQLPNDDLGLYRDDGLGTTSSSGREADRARKTITQIFKNHGLQVTIETRLTRTDFLDVTLDITTGKYWPYRKPNNELQYVHSKSNHPPSILKQLPHSITNRIASLSCNAEEYERALPAYKDALEKSGHHHPVTTALPGNQTTGPKRQRKRNIIWFNPPLE